MTQTRTPVDPPLPPETEPVLARLEASPARRVLGAGVLGGLGLILLWLALWHPPGRIALQLMLLVLAGGAIALTVALWQATRVGLILTARELRDTEGERLALVSQIEAVSRGALAFKPSQGFVLRLAPDAGGARRWRPGLWWRLGRSLGVGGVTPRNEGRFMAEAIAGLIGQGASSGRLPQ